MLSIPVYFEAEYRKLARLAGEFEGTNPDTGKPETVSYAEAVNFEHESEDGVTTVIPVRAVDLDKVTPPFDYRTLTKGDRVTITGYCSLAERNSKKDSYLVVTKVVAITGSASRKVPAAA